MAAPVAPVVWYYVRRSVKKHGVKTSKRLVQGANLYTRGKKAYRTAKRQYDKFTSRPKRSISKSSRRSTSVRNVRRGGNGRYNSRNNRFKQKLPPIMKRRGKRCPNGYRYNRKLNACVKMK